MKGVCELCLEPLNWGKKFCSRKCTHEYLRRRAQILALTPDEGEALGAALAARLDPDDTDSLLMIQSANEARELFTRLMGEPDE